MAKLGSQISLRCIFLDYGRKPEHTEKTHKGTGTPEAAVRTMWCWYYLADCGSWHRFEDDPNVPFSSSDLERFYLQNPKDVLNALFSSYRSRIDFSAMLETDLNTGRQRRIHRSYNIEKGCSCFNAAPVFWEPFDPACPYQLIPLSELTPEYQTVANYVKTDGLLDKPIVSISRIQNLDLWELYCRKKKHLMRIKGVKEIQERRLFHGTKIKNVHYICKYNFDVRLPGQNGHSYGKGIYFAKYAAHADNYSVSSTDPLPMHGGKTQPEHTKIIILARVMVGKPSLGQFHFQKPDDGSPENLHDSCVDNIDHPNIFVIFDSNQIYPEYLIQYR